MGKALTATIFGGGPALPSPTANLAVQLVCVLLSCALVERVGLSFRQPAVVAEKVAGILLGPSVLGAIPGMQSAIFPPSSLPGLKAVADVGLVLFMFYTGATHDLATLWRHARQSFVISLAGIAGAAALGIGAAVGIHSYLEPPAPPLGPFLLFACTSLAATAMPVLARVLADARLLGTQIGAAALHAAAFDDAVVMIVVCIDVAVIRANSNLDVLWTLMCLSGFALLLVLSVRPVATWAAGIWLAQHSVTHDERKPRVPHLVIAIVVAFAFLSAWITELVGAHAVAGAFLAGVCTPRVSGIAAATAARIELLTMQLLMPVRKGRGAGHCLHDFNFTHCSCLQIYFCYSGQRTQLGTIASSGLWPLAIAATLCAVVGKAGGVALASRATGFNWRSAGAVGALMNSKGLLELIVLNVGADFEVLPAPAFSVLVFASLGSMLLTLPLLYIVYPPGELHADDAAARAPPPPPGGVLNRLLLVAGSASETRSLLGVAAAILSGVGGFYTGKSEPPALWCGLLRSVPRRDAEAVLRVGFAEGGASCPFVRGADLLLDADESSRDGLDAIEVLMPTPKAALGVRRRSSAASDAIFEEESRVYTRTAVDRSAAESYGGVESADIAAARPVLQGDAVTMMAIATAQSLGLLPALRVGLSRSSNTSLDIADTALENRPGLLLLPAAVVDAPVIARAPSRRPSRGSVIIWDAVRSAVASAQTHDATPWPPLLKLLRTSSTCPLVGFVAVRSLVAVEAVQRRVLVVLQGTIGTDDERTGTLRVAAQLAAQPSTMLTVLILASRPSWAQAGDSSVTTRGALTLSRVALTLGRPRTQPPGPVAPKAATARSVLEIFPTMRAKPLEGPPRQTASAAFVAQIPHAAPAKAPVATNRECINVSSPPQHASLSLDELPQIVQAAETSANLAVAKVSPELDGPKERPTPALMCPGVSGDDIPVIPSSAAQDTALPDALASALPLKRSSEVRTASPFNAGCARLDTEALPPLPHEHDTTDGAALAHGASSLPLKCTSGIPGPLPDSVDCIPAASQPAAPEASSTMPLVSSGATIVFSIAAAVVSLPAILETTDAEKEGLIDGGESPNAGVTASDTHKLPEGHDLTAARSDSDSATIVPPTAEARVPAPATSLLDESVSPSDANPLQESSLGAENFSTPSASISMPSIDVTDAATVMISEVLVGHDELTASATLLADVATAPGVLTVPVTHVVSGTTNMATSADEDASSAPLPARSADTQPVSPPQMSTPSLPLPPPHPTAHLLAPNVAAWPPLAKVDSLSSVTGVTVVDNAVSLAMEPSIESSGRSGEPSTRGNRTQIGVHQEHRGRDSTVKLGTSAPAGAASSATQTTRRGSIVGGIFATARTVGSLLGGSLASATDFPGTSRTGRVADWSVSSRLATARRIFGPSPTTAQLECVELVDLSLGAPDAPGDTDDALASRAAAALVARLRRNTTESGRGVAAFDMVVASGLQSTLPKEDEVLGSDAAVVVAALAAAGKRERERRHVNRPTIQSMFPGAVERQRSTTGVQAESLDRGSDPLAEEGPRRKPSMSVGSGVAHASAWRPLGRLLTDVSDDLPPSLVLLAVADTAVFAAR